MRLLSPRLPVIAACVAAVCAATAAAQTSEIVAPQGTAAGRSYPQALATYWKYMIEHAPRFSPCATVNGVILPFGAGTSQQTIRTCSVDARQVVYIPGFSVECSTLEKAPFHAGTATQLKRCAKRGYDTVKRRSASRAARRVTVDGNSIDLAPYAAASKPFVVHLPKNNVLRSNKRDGLAAAYGEALLIENLSPGPHVVHSTVGKKEVAYQLNVAG